MALTSLTQTRNASSMKLRVNPRAEFRRVIALAASSWFESLVSKDVVITTGMVRGLREEMAMRRRIRELDLPLKLPAVLRILNVELKDMTFSELSPHNDLECLIVVENYKIRMTNRSLTGSAWLDDDLSLMIKRPSSYLRVLVRDELGNVLGYGDGLTC